MKRWVIMLLILLPLSISKAEIILPEQLTIIEDEAFQGDLAMTSVIIPDKVRVIGFCAFADTALQDIIIPASVETIGADAFERIKTPMLISTVQNSFAVTFAMRKNIDFMADTIYRALVIGQTDYPGDNRLSGPASDITKIKKVLANYAVTTLTNLTAEEILDAISLTFADAKDEDISFFYYAGHGNETDGSLVGIDMETYVTPAKLRSALDEIPGRKIIIVDACYSGALIGRSASKQNVTDPASLFVDAFKNRRILLSSNLATHPYYVITSSKGDEESWEKKNGGIFTDAFVKSKTSGDRDDDQVITFEEAYIYTKEKVQEMASASEKVQSVQVYPENCNWFGLFR